MSEARELLDQLCMEQKARTKAIAQIADLTNERDELKVRIEELEQALRLINGAAWNIYWEIDEPKKASEYINSIFKDTGVEYSS